MITPHEDGWIDECWGRIVIGIGEGNGKRELASILGEVSEIRFEAGKQAEIDRRTREIAERLMGRDRTCAGCSNIFQPPELSGGPYYCNDCNIPF